jgi:hypothetical protein
MKDVLANKTPMLVSRRAVFEYLDQQLLQMQLSIEDLETSLAERPPEVRPAPQEPGEKPARRGATKSSGTFAQSSPARIVRRLFRPVGHSGRTYPARVNSRRLAPRQSMLKV